jgi:DHA2 family multidrug resistance protein
LIAITTVLPSFMVALDTSVANVSLPRIAAGLSANTLHTTAILTGYLVANAIVLPATGWLSQFFGRKRLLIASIGLFTLASVACGEAWSLQMLIIARVVQGASGGALLPVSQAVLLESFRPEKRGEAMAAYGMGAIVAPIVGPTLGGWITDHYSWRWVFYINVPVGIVAAVMAVLLIEDPPYLKHLVRRGIDYVGFAAMAVGLGALQIFLDRGQEHHWFATTWITWLAAVSAGSLLVFVLWELRASYPIVDLRVMRNRNFAVAVPIAAIYGVILYGSLVLVSLLLQDLMGYPAAQTGIAITPRGVGAMFSMLIAGRLVRRLDGRILIASGFLLLAWGSFLLGHVSRDLGLGQVLLPNAIMGGALGFIFVPLTTMCVGTLPNEQIGTATGIYNLMRNMGGSVGIAGVATVLAHATHTHQASLLWAHGALDGLLLKKAILGGFVDTFNALSYVALAVLPLAMLLKHVVEKERLKPVVNGESPQPVPMEVE